MRPLLRGMRILKARRQTVGGSPIHRINSMLCAIRLQAECLQQRADLEDVALEIRTACKEIQKCVDELANNRAR